MARLTSTSNESGTPSPSVSTGTGAAQPPTRRRVRAADIEWAIRRVAFPDDEAVVVHSQRATETPAERTEVLPVHLPASMRTREMSRERCHPVSTRPRRPPGRVVDAIAWLGGRRGCRGRPSRPPASTRTRDTRVAGGAARRRPGRGVHRGRALSLPPRVPRSTIPPACVHENAWGRVAAVSAPADDLAGVVDREGAS